MVFLCPQRDVKLRRRKRGQVRNTRLIILKGCVPHEPS